MYILKLAIIAIILIIILIVISNVEYDIISGSEYTDVKIADKNLYLYNLSARKTDTGYSGVIRGSTNIKNSPFSYSYYVNINESGKVNNLKRIELDYGDMNLCNKYNGFEDSRLFIYKNEEWVIGNILGSKIQKHACNNTMCIYKISDPKNTFKVLEVPVGYNPKQKQKNWSPFEYNEELYCEYSIKPHIIFKIYVDTGITEEVCNTGGELSPSVTTINSLRGGAPPILININKEKFKNYANDVKSLEGKIIFTRDDTTQKGISHLENLVIPDSFYLGIGHSLVSIFGPQYVSFAYIFEAKHPFNIIKISKKFKLDKLENIQFVSGLSCKDDIIHITYGINDKNNRISKFALYDILCLFDFVMV